MEWFAASQVLGLIVDHPTPMCALKRWRLNRAVVGKDAVT